MSRYSDEPVDMAEALGAISHMSYERERRRKAGKPNEDDIQLIATELYDELYRRYRADRDGSFNRQQVALLKRAAETLGKQFVDEG